MKQELINKPKEWPWNTYLEILNNTGTMVKLMAFSDKPVQPGDILLDRRTSKTCTCQDIFQCEEGDLLSVELGNEEIDLVIPAEYFFKIVPFVDKFN